MALEPFSSGLLGAFFGAANGWASRLAMRRVLRAGNAVFLAVFAAGLLYRLGFLLASVWFLRNEKYIIIIPFAAALIAVQVGFELVPLDKDGTERNTRAPHR